MKSLCALLLSTVLLDPPQNSSVPVAESIPRAVVVTKEMEMYEFALGKFVNETPNNYRKEMMKDERSVAKKEYADFLQAKRDNVSHPGFDMVIFNGKEQKTYHLNKKTDDTVEILGEYDCSSAKGGFSNRNKSNKTATGLFYITSRQGEGAKVGTIFDNEYLKRAPRVIKPGKNTGTKAYMTTRRLDFEKWRGQAFHGTNHEAYLKTKRSHGCIRMSNADVITFFNAVQLGTPVYISPNYVKEANIEE